MTDAGPRGLIPGGALLRRPVAAASVAAFPEPATASTPETTRLAPEEQAAFELWLKQNNIHDLDDPRSHYDYRGAFKAGVGREPGAEGHFPDTFKQHGHETFSNESQYSKGDGGTWQGDTFIPPKSGMRPSAAAEPRAKGPLGPLPGAPPKVNAPYGMKPGVRHLLPGISPRQAERKTLSVDEDAEFVLPDGSVIPLTSRNPRDKEIVTKLGQSLFNMSGNDAEKRVAAAVTEWAQSMVGQMPIDDIQKVMAERWDHNVGNVIKRDVSRDRIMAAAANRGANARNPNLPGKDDAAASKELFNMEQDVIKQHITSNKGAAINTLLGDFNRLESLVSSDSPMAQRIAPMVELLTLTGKASRESEQAGVTQGAGLWESWKNKLSLLNPNDTSMTDAYRAAFMDYLKTEKEAVMKHKKDLATLAANDIAYAVSRAYGPEVAQASARRVYGNIYGEFASPTFDPDKDASRDTATPIARPGMVPPKAAAAAPKAAPKAAAPAPKALPKKYQGLAD